MRARPKGSRATRYQNGGISARPRLNVEEASGTDKKALPASANGSQTREGSSGGDVDHGVRASSAVTCDLAARTQSSSRCGRLREICPANGLAPLMHHDCDMRSRSSHFALALNGAVSQTRRLGTGAALVGALLGCGESAGKDAPPSGGAGASAGGGAAAGAGGDTSTGGAHSGGAAGQTSTGIGGSGGEAGGSPRMPPDQRMALCGAGEGVRIIDVDQTLQSGYQELEVWRAADRPELDSAQKSKLKSFADCKPVAGGQRLLLASSNGGAAVVDGTSGAVLGYGTAANAHSITLLPNGRFAVAGSNTPNESTGDRVAVFDLKTWDQAIIVEPLTSAHALVWDDARQRLWAAGHDQLRSYKLIAWKTTTPSLAVDVSLTLPEQGAHDLSPVPDSANVMLSTKGHVWLFDRDTHSLTPHPAAELVDQRKIKSLDLHPVTGRLAYTFGEEKNWWATRVSLLNPTDAIDLPGGDRVYKARWFARHTADP